MKTLVTGATGFVGEKLANKLLDLGHNLRVLSRSGSLPESLSYKDVEVVRGDVCDADSIHKAVAGCRYVFHLAGVVGYSKAMRTAMVEANVGGTANVLDASIKNNVEKLFYMSSVVAIGASFSPAKVLNEDSPFNIRHLNLGYFETKHQAENLVRAAVRDGKIHAVMANPSTIYGPGDALKGSRRTQVKVARGKFPFYTGGGVNVVHIDDCLNGCLRIFERGRPGERYIICGENLTIKQLFTFIAQEAKVRPPFIKLPTPIVRGLGRWGDLKEKQGGKGMINSENAWASTLYHWFSCEKAQRELGFTYRPAREAIAESVNWMRQKGLI